jgi:hypothetical protein
MFCISQYTNEKVTHQNNVFCVRKTDRAVSDLVEAIYMSVINPKNVSVFRVITIFVPPFLFTYDHKSLQYCMSSYKF